MPAAQSLLGEMYLNGRGTPRDYRRALGGSSHGATQGEPVAQNNVGIMYQGGIGGLRQDDRQAAEWFPQSGRAGVCHGTRQPRRDVLCPAAACPGRDAQAVAWFRKAAEQGDSSAPNTTSAAFTLMAKAWRRTISRQ